MTVTLGLGDWNEAKVISFLLLMIGLGIAAFGVLIAVTLFRRTLRGELDVTHWFTDPTGKFSQSKTFTCVVKFVLLYVIIKDAADGQADPYVLGTCASLVLGHELWKRGQNIRITRDQLELSGKGTSSE